LSEGQVVVMYHLGPGTFSSSLLHHYSRRDKLKAPRVPAFLISKLFFHFLQRGGSGAARKWSLHFRRNRRTPLPVQSEEGLLFRKALAIAFNVGYAYRLGTVRAIIDGLHEAAGPSVKADLLCDISHNGIYEERQAGRWVARHNACPAAAGAPAIVAGSYDVCSFLGIGLSQADPHLNSYDHGAGSLIEAARAAGELPAEAGSVLRLRMTRGRSGRIVRHHEAPLRTDRPARLVMEALERHQVLQPVARLRPLGNLKN
jgi:RNA-splicing ligase RtcB